MLEIPQRPLAARAADLGYRIGRLVGWDRAPITPEDAKERAVAMAGLDDFGGDDFEEGLAVFCRAADEDADLDLLGREIIRAMLRRILVNRLTLIDYGKSHDLAAPIRPPLLILGLPRTGSTFLQRLLATDPAAYAPPTWKMWHPLPIPGKPDRRRQAVLNAIGSMRTLTPQLDAKHFLDADQPEECFHLRDPSFRGPGPYQLCWAPSYQRWLREQDVGPSYAMYARYLRVFQAEHPQRHLVLKSPLHTGHVREIVQHVPEVKLIQTHRDPAEVVPSTISMGHTMLSLANPRLDPQVVAQATLTLLTDMLEDNAAQRAELSSQVVDVAFEELVADPLAAVRRIYAGHDLDLTAEAEAAMRHRIDHRPRHKHGVHRYAAADFGLTPEGIRERFADYIATHLG